MGLDPVAFPSGNAELRIELNDSLGGYIACHVDYNEPTWDLYLDTVHGASLLPGPLRLVVGTDATGSVCSINGAPTTDGVTAMRGAVQATILMQNQLVASVRYIVVYGYTPP